MPTDGEHFPKDSHAPPDQLDASVPSSQDKMNSADVNDASRKKAREHARKIQESLASEPCSQSRPGTQAGAYPHAARASRAARVWLRTRGIFYWPFRKPRRP
jgi:hypothetical protein